jgi:hypothetical protein
VKLKSTIFFFLIFSFLFSASILAAQTSSSSTTNDPKMVSTQFDTTGFPQWAKDLRRAEIVTFGSFPFTYFLTTTLFDTYRCANNGWDRRYAPWPFDAAGSINQTQKEKARVIWMAAGCSVLISLVDYAIVRYQRNRAEREIENLPPGTPIIIRKPLYEGEGGELPDEAPPENAETGAP